MIIRIDDKQTLEIANPAGSGDKLILLLPVTRDLRKNPDFLSKFTTLVAQSRLHAVVIIDKTQDSFLEGFLLQHYEHNPQLVYILKRPSTEAIFDSQKFVTIPEGTFIIQIHDDDSWNGTLKLPSELMEFEYFASKFRVKNEDGTLERVSELYYPAEVVFSCIPWHIWNRFMHFIDEQGGHVAGTLDSTMSLIVNLVCERKHLENFEYHYSLRHWSNRKSSRAHLRTLVIDDGWGDYSSVEVSLINRAIDSLVALHAFRDLISEEKFIEAIKTNLTSFSPRYVSLKRIEISFGVFKAIQRFILAWSKVMSSAGIPATRLFAKTLLPLEMSLSRLGILIEFSKVRDVQDVYRVLNSKIDLALIPKLRQRIVFWKKTLSEANNLR